MRVFVTGGAGFIGGAVVRGLRERGDMVTAVVRDPSRAAYLATLGVELVAGDLGDPEEIRRRLVGYDAVIHLAGSYRIGIAPSERPAMWEANVRTTERVLDASIAAGVGRIVHVSTCNVFGDTHGRIVDETYRRDLREGFVSWYDETKYRAHRAAEERIAQTAPIVIAMPGGTYGRGDHSAAGAQLERAYHGRLGAVALGDAGLSWVHVDDVAQGIVASLDRGRVGEAYALAGPALRLREAVAIAARVGGRPPPRFEIPSGPLRLIARAGRLPGISRLREVVSASDGVTYWASHDKAARELGFAPRDLDQGVRDAWA